MKNKGGRPAKKPEDRTKYERPALHAETYEVIKAEAKRRNIPISHEIARKYKVKVHVR